MVSGILERCYYGEKTTLGKPKRTNVLLSDYLISRMLFGNWSNLLNFYTEDKWHSPVLRKRVSEEYIAVFDGMLGNVNIQVSWDHTGVANRKAQPIRHSNPLRLAART